MMVHAVTGRLSHFCAFSTSAQRLPSAAMRCAVPRFAPAPLARRRASTPNTFCGSAKSAFRDLAYKNFKHVPMFLEWAPIAIFNRAATELGALKGDEQQSSAARSNAAATDRSGIKESADDDGDSGETGAPT